MKKIVLAMVAAVTLLSGCVAYAPAPRYQDHSWGQRDRDRDGVPNRHDRRPHDPRWY